jgi:hypothetical protein
MWFGKRRALTALGLTLEWLNARSSRLGEREERELLGVLAAIQTGEYAVAIQKLQAIHGAFDAAAYSRGSR